MSSRRTNTSPKKLQEESRIIIFKYEYTFFAVIDKRSRGNKMVWGRRILERIWLTKADRDQRWLITLHYPCAEYFTGSTPAHDG